MAGQRWSLVIDLSLLMGYSALWKVMLHAAAGKWQPSKVSYTQMAQAQVLCLEHASRDPAAQTSGVSFVSDFEGWSFSNMRFVERGITRDYFRYVQVTVLGLFFSGTMFLERPKREKFGLPVCTLSHPFPCPNELKECLNTQYV